MKIISWFDCVYCVKYKLQEEWKKLVLSEVTRGPPTITLVHKWHPRGWSWSASRGKVKINCQELMVITQEEKGIYGWNSSDLYLLLKSDVPPEEQKVSNIPQNWRGKKTNDVCDLWNYPVSPLSLETLLKNKNSKWNSYWLDSIWIWMSEILEGFLRNQTTFEQERFV